MECAFILELRTRNLFIRPIRWAHAVAQGSSFDAAAASPRSRRQGVDIWGALLQRHAGARLDVRPGVEYRGIKGTAGATKRRSSAYGRAGSLLKEVAVDVQAVDIHREPTSSCVSVAADLMGRMGESGYVEQMTESLSHYVKFAHVCVLCFSGLKPPGLLGTGSTLSPACAENTAYIYLDGHYNSDPTGKLRAASVGPDEQLYVQRQRVEDIANAEYRTSCYERPGIVDRLSLFQHFGPETWIAVNVYRDSSQGYFDSTECARLVTVAPILTASAAKHRQLVAKAERPSTQVRNASAPSAVQQRLATVCAILSNREYEVCDRILRGFSSKEIAQQLGIAPSTVAEHRKNAYAKLAVRGYKQLFAQFFA